MRKISGVVVAAFCLAAAAQAGPLGTVTVADGRAHVARGSMVYTPAEGVVLEEGDILELEEGALLQIELSDGSALSFSSRAQARLPAAGAGGKPGDLLFASGWAKLHLTSAAQVPAVSSAQVRLIGQNTVYVMSAGADGTALFLESGELVPVFAGAKAGQPAVIKGGDFVAVKPDFSVTSAKRAPPPFVAAMPKVYLDQLPVRLAKLKARGVEPRRERDAGFADLDAWVKRYPSARAALLAQFTPLLKDKEFLAQLEPAIKDYPEWEQAIRPEKTKGKPTGKAAPKAK